MNDVVMLEAEVMYRFDNLPAFHPDAVELARTYPGIYRRWGVQVDAGQRIWHARTPRETHEG